MSILGRGRPSRQDPPVKLGIYQFVRKDSGDVTYTGEINDLRGRKHEHTRSGLFEPDVEYFEWQVADGRSTSRTRREIETSRIDQQDPDKNRHPGGSGRPAHDWRISDGDGDGDGDGDDDDFDFDDDDDDDDDLDLDDDDDDDD